MKVSFIIPAHNEEKYIIRCLKSVKQELSSDDYDAEIIVVDNASTDKTCERVESFPGVRVINEPHKGLSQARQAGFLASTGELIANIDADTIVPVGWLKTVMVEFTKEKNLVALSGPHIYYDLSIYSRLLVKIFYFLGYTTHIINHHILGIGAMLQGGNFIVRRSALEKINGYNTSIEFYGEDTDVGRRLAQIGKVKWTFHLPIYASGRRIKNEGIITMGSRYALNYFWVIFSGKPFTKNVSENNRGK